MTKEPTLVGSFLQVVLDNRRLFPYNKSIKSGKEFRFTIVCLPQKPEKGVLRLFCKKEF